MSSVNKIILVGHLGADPEMRFLPEGGAVCNLRMATTDKWKDKNTGELREATEWHRVVMYRKLAETAGHYLKKGACIYVEGRLHYREWKDREGRDRQSTEIEAAAMQMLGSGRAAPTFEKPEAVTPKSVAPEPLPPDFGDDDVPF